MKFQSIYIYIALFLLLSISHTFAQETGFSQRKSFLQQQVVLPTTPEASSLGKYGDFQVNYYTGAVDINIPIYTMKGKLLEVPIYLQYDGSGHKVEQEASWVGLGWTLNAGGVITRSVRGLPDMDNFFENIQKIIDNLQIEDLSLKTNNFYYDIASGRVEAQKDNYYFNFPGAAGKFYVVGKDYGTRNVVQKEEQNLLIEVEFDPIEDTNKDDILGFTITDAGGTKYEFDAAERTTLELPIEELFPDDPEAYIEQRIYRFNSSWHLTKITAPDNIETIEFQYETETTAYEPPFNDDAYNTDVDVTSSTNANTCVSNPDPPCTSSQGTNLGSFNTFEINNRKFLSKIIYRIRQNVVEVVEFESLDNPCIHASETNRRLFRINIQRGHDPDITDTNNELTTIKRFSFSYNLDDCDTQGRLLLEKIQETPSDKTQILKGAYEFEYNGINLPNPMSNSIDHWGYYNGAGNSSLIPNINPSCAGTTTLGSGAGRLPSTTNMKASILEKITYPTGGYTEYDYEAHIVEGKKSGHYEYACSQNVNVDRVVGGLRIDQITNYDSDGTFINRRGYEYRKGVSSSESSGLLFTEPDYLAPSSSYTFHARNFLQPGPCDHEAYGYSCNYTTATANSYAVLGTVQGSHVGYSKVEEIIEANDGTNAGRVVYTFQNEKFNNRYEDNVENGHLLTQEVYDNNNRILERTSSTYEFETVLDDGNVTGELIAPYTMTIRAKAAQDNQNYLCITDPNADGVWIDDMNQTDPPPGETNDSSETDLSDCTEGGKVFKTKYTRGEFHFLRTTTTRMTSQTAEKYFYDDNDNQSVITTVSNYEYNDDKLKTVPTETSVTNSEGEVHKTVNVYLSDRDDPNYTFDDSGTASTVYDELETENRYATPLMTEQYIDDQLIYRTSIEYDKFGNIIRPYKFYEKFPDETNNILQEVIAGYDAAGNITQAYRYHNGDADFTNNRGADDHQPMSFIWGDHKTVLTASVQNATQSEIAYTSFETEESSQGGWTVENPENNVYDVSQSRTGKAYANTDPASRETKMFLTKIIDAGRYYLSINRRGSYVYEVDHDHFGSTRIHPTFGTDAQGWTYELIEFEITQRGNLSVELARGEFDEVRLYPADALMMTYSYDKDNRLMLSQAEQNSISTNFEYDELLRLKGTKNFDNHYLQVYEYLYRDAMNSDNAVRNWNVLKSAVTDIDGNGGVKELNFGDVRRTYNYFDGIGRPIQSVALQQAPRNGSGVYKDVVSFMEYDKYGREPVKYLPYTIATNNTTPGAYRMNAKTEQESFCSTEFGNGEMMFGRMEYNLEESPLNRVEEEYAPGSAFQNTPRTVKYLLNGESEVRDFYVAANPSINITGYYDANTLYKIEQYDEDGKRVTTYTDRIGRTIMVDNEGAKTYYIYNNRNLLTQVVQPEGAELAHTNPMLTFASPSIKDHSFSYTYDEEFRLVTKRIPGTTEDYIYHYDRLDRVVLTEDPNGFKTFIKYDILGRPIMSGKYTGGNEPCLGDDMFEIVNDTATHLYTTDRAFPVDDENIDIYTVNYYDDYNLDNDNSTFDDEVSYQAPDSTLFEYYDAENFPFVQGKITGSKTAILQEDGSAPTEYLETYTFYDKFGRIIQTQVDNHLDGKDVTWHQYNYPGWLLRMRREHSATVDGQAQSIVINQRFTYDHTGRPRDTYHQIGDVAADEILICKKSYNQRNELDTKEIGMPNGVTEFLQKVDYDYNIRGWLTQINEVVDNNAESIDDNDVFAMKLSYTQNDNIINPTATGNFNGNISAIEWRVNGNSKRHIYSYEYDNMNRLTSSTYGEKSSSTQYINASFNRYNTTYTYDLDGNIETLTRRGYRGTSDSYGNIDNMGYTYSAIGRLTEITEDSEKNIGFKSIAPTVNGTATATYAYDANGNMTTDNHKGLTVAYNFLNLPTSVSKTGVTNDITWTYDAAGNKLRKKVGNISTATQEPSGMIADDTYEANELITSTGEIDGGSDVTFLAGEEISLEEGFDASDGFDGQVVDAEDRHYVGGIEYSNGRLEAIYHGAGRVVLLEDDTYEYEYQVSDHLGNTRVVFRDYRDGEVVLPESSVVILQENHYYAFGMSMGGMNENKNDYTYLYNGKEIQKELDLGWLDYGARCYDPSMGRWLHVDPIVEVSPHINPYVYVENQPIIAIDPNGLIRANYMDRDPFKKMKAPDFLWNPSKNDTQKKMPNLIDLSNRSPVIGSSSESEQQNCCPVKEGDTIKGVDGTASIDEIVVTAPKYPVGSDNTGVDVVLPVGNGLGNTRGGLEVLGLGYSGSNLDDPYGTSNGIVDMAEFPGPAGGGVTGNLWNMISTWVGAGQHFGVDNYLFSEDWIPARQKPMDMQTGSHHVYTNETRDTLIFESTSEYSESFKRVNLKRKGILQNVITSKDSTQVIKDGSQ